MTSEETKYEEIRKRIKLASIALTCIGATGANVELIVSAGDNLNRSLQALLNRRNEIAEDMLELAEAQILVAKERDVS